MTTWKSIIVLSNKKETIYNLDKNEKVFPRTNLRRTRSIYKELNIFKLIDKNEIQKETQQVNKTENSFVFQEFQIFSNPKRDFSKSNNNIQSINLSQTTSTNNSEKDKEKSKSDWFKDFENEPDIFPQDSDDWDESDISDMSLFFS